MKIHPLSLLAMNWLLLMPAAYAQYTLAPGSPETAGKTAAPEDGGNIAFTTPLNGNNSLAIDNPTSTGVPTANFTAPPAQPVLIASNTQVFANETLIDPVVLANINSTNPSNTTTLRPAVPPPPAPVTVAPGTSVRGYATTYAPYTVGNTTSMNFPTGNTNAPAAPPRPVNVAPGTAVIGNNTLYGNYTVGNTTSTNFPQGNTSSPNFP